MELGPKQKEWVEALRSGKYEQGKSFLHTRSSKFCCLGIACDISKERLGLVVGHFGDSVTYTGMDCFLPHCVIEDLRLNGDGGYFIDRATMNDPQGGALLALFKGIGECDSLADANDKDATFPEIADFIESNPELVFTGPA